MKFSIVIPTFNPAMEDLTECLFSVFSQTVAREDYEILLVDDKSTNWFKAPYEDNEMMVTTMLGVPIIRSPINGGPGAARNLGLDKAKGDWVLFLDSDDHLAPNALEEIDNYITRNSGVDLVGFNWEFSHNRGVPQRKDLEDLKLDRLELLKKYLRLQMDGSVIFSAFKRTLMDDPNRMKVRFMPGYHEDVDFMYFMYQSASKIGYLDHILYQKVDRDGSIVRTITPKHILGFIRAWESVHTVLDNPPKLLSSYMIGVTAVVATRAREIHRLDPDNERTLYQFLKRSLPEGWAKMVEWSGIDTQYSRIARSIVMRGDVDPELYRMSWSCTDLQGSLFLAPNEVRTCCKRFFVDGEIRGDVKLVGSDDVTPDNILKAKKDLIKGINSGDKTPCSGCNFMEFKDWEPVKVLKVKYLSMEHHSVCNMKCSYCDDTYYGGKHAEYDVRDLVDQLDLSELRTVVWGGGEPTIGKDFRSMALDFAMTPHTKQRVLTNSLKFSPTLLELLSTNSATVFTSVDAGNQETFTKVRGMGNIHRVMRNIEDYSQANPKAVTLKYILTDQNSTAENLYGFVDLISTYRLKGSNFQISCDFKQPMATSYQLSLAILLKDHLHKIGCKVVFFDDLAMQRFVKYLRSGKFNEKRGLAGVDDPDNYPDGVTVFGTGAMYQWMLENSPFMRKVKVVTTDEYIPGIPVLIMGSQGYPEAYYRAIEAGVPEDQIINKVII